MIEISKVLFDQWNDASIEYCHWKSNEHLEEGLNGLTDLDVLLSLEDKEKACSILQQLNFLSCKSQIGSRYPGVEDWIGFDNETGMLIHLHLHYQIVTGHKGMKEYNLPWSSECLLTRVQDKDTNVFISNPNLEIVTLYTRIGLKASPMQIARAKNGKYDTGDDNRKEITYLKERVDWDEVSKIVKHYYGDISERMLSIMHEDELSSSSFITLKEVAEKAMTPYRRFGAIGTFVRQWYYQILLRGLSHLKFSRGWNIILRKTPISCKGLVVAFIGQDGAGKSTVTKEIEKWLSWKLDVKQFYLGSGDHFNSWEKRMQEKLHSHNDPFSKAIRAFLPFSLLKKLASNVYSTIKKGNKYASKGGIAIFDRFPQTQFMGINDGPKIRYFLLPKVDNGLLKRVVTAYANREERILAKAVTYEPDVVIKLILSPEESIRRKPHENYEAVKQKHEIIRALSFEKSEVYTIAADQPYEEEILQIKRILWSHISK